MNHLYTSKPMSWKRYAHQHFEMEQWSRANVITRAATRTAKCQIIEGTGGNCFFVLYWYPYIVNKTFMLKVNLATSAILVTFTIVKSWNL